MISCELDKKLSNFEKIVFKTTAATQPSVIGQMTSSVFSA